MGRLVCVLIVRKLSKTGFLTSRPIYSNALQSSGIMEANSMNPDQSLLWEQSYGSSLIRAHTVCSTGCQKVCQRMIKQKKLVMNGGQRIIYFWMHTIDELINC